MINFSITTYEKTTSIHRFICGTLLHTYDRQKILFKTWDTYVGRYVTETHKMLKNAIIETVKSFV